MLTTCSINNMSLRSFLLKSFYNTQKKNNRPTFPYETTMRCRETTNFQIALIRARDDRVVSPSRSKHHFSTNVPVKTCIGATTCWTTTALSIDYTTTRAVQDIQNDIGSNNNRPQNATRNTKPHCHKRNTTTTTCQNKLRTRSHKTNTTTHERTQTNTRNISNSTATALSLKTRLRQQSLISFHIRIGITVSVCEIAITQTTSKHHRFKQQNKN